MLLWSIIQANGPSSTLVGIPWSVIWAVTMALGSLVVTGVTLWMDDRNRKKFAPLSPLYDEKGNPCWVTRREVDNMGARINEVSSKINLSEGKTASVEHQMELLQQHFNAQNERMMEKVTEAVASLKAVTDRLERVSEQQGAQAALVNTLLRSRHENRPGE